MKHRIQLAEANELPSMHAILTLCGEHMNRVQGLSHWHPYGSFEAYKEASSDGKVYGVYVDEFLVGSFYLSEIMPHYVKGIAWAKTDAKVLYGSKFGILPMMQKRGIGAITMQAIDRLVEQEGYEALRFDAVSRNPALTEYYNKLGYQERGKLGDVAVFFEKVFPV